MSEQKLSFEVVGLGCGGAGAGTLERALSKLKGVERVYVNPLTERAYLEYDPVRVSFESVRQTIANLGYHIRLN
ncbi:MAG: heavy-metal-associated domain-containing protein [Thermaceae bacterium]|nr:heavy-metal-associated domain-containing protein [Thermaceae bacterium]